MGIEASASRDCIGLPELAAIGRSHSCIWRGANSNTHQIHTKYTTGALGGIQQLQRVKGPFVYLCICVFDSAAPRPLRGHIYA
jgi:hypothetical protein